MAGIQFEEDQQYQPGYGMPEQSVLIRWVLATGLVKGEKQAQYVLLGIVVAAILIMLFIWTSGGSAAPAQTAAAPGWPQPVR